MFCLSGQATAQELESEFLYGFDLKASIGYAVPNTDDYDNSFTFQVSAGYDVAQWLNLELGVGYFSSQIDYPFAGPPAHTIAEGDLKVIPFTLTAQVRHSLPELFLTVYALGGVGYYLVDYTWSGGSEAYFDGIRETYGAASQSVDDSFGFHLGGGLEYPLTASLALAAEGRYIVLRPGASGDWTDPVTEMPVSFDDELDLNTWLFFGGLKYMF